MLERLGETDPTVTIGRNVDGHLHVQLNINQISMPLVASRNSYDSNFCLRSK